MFRQKQNRVTMNPADDIRGNFREAMSRIEDESDLVSELECPD